MDLFHRQLKKSDLHTGRECRFCSQADPEFYKRQPIDRLVSSKLEDVAASHLTEEGHVQHRLVELRRRRATIMVQALPVSA
ncbi:MAG TPA: hypothetical protein VF753_12395 [Terriglobales bacterium]